MGDSSTFGDVPNKFDVVGAYANGHFGVATIAQLAEKYPGRGHVLFDVLGDRPDAQARDWENGDKGGNLATWVVDHNLHTRIKDAVIYCDRSTIPEVRRLTGKQILAQDYWLHVSTLDGTEYTGEGVIACQNKGSKLTGGHWDESVVYNDDFYKSSTVVTTGKVTKTKPNCERLQTALHTKADNLWGPTTDLHGQILLASSVRSFPRGIALAQQVVGTTVDAVWGPKSVEAMHRTVANVQVALIGMGFNPGKVDGFWGTNTGAAYNIAKAACHI
jgi:hypothetical protein